MNDLSPAAFFDLSTFAHKALFKEGMRVWDAIKAIASYLEDYTFTGVLEEYPGVFFKNPSEVSIGKGTVIEPGAYIEGPTILGQECVVRHGAYVRAGVITGDRCVIGHATEIKHSILLDEAKAPHFNYVGDSILGNKSNIGAGVICANLRFDKGEIEVVVGEETFSTGMKKLGLILGDEGQVGCNAVPNPGTLIGKGRFASPCRSIRSKV